MTDDGLAARRHSVHQELERSRADLHHLIRMATPVDLRRATVGTRWTNGQLLWHMAFGYVIVLRLHPLVRAFDRLPDSVGRAYAGMLSAGRVPFHFVNYIGAVGGASVIHGPRLDHWLDCTISQLHACLDTDADAALRASMHFPRGWDPFFRESMTLIDTYHYATQHYDFHRRQLTLDH